MRNKLKVVQVTVSEKFVECINSIPPDIDLIYPYVCVQTIKGNMNVRVDEVYIDGYRAEGVYYPFTPFMPVGEVDYPIMVKNEKEVLEKIAKREKNDKKETNSLKIVN